LNLINQEKVKQNTKTVASLVKQQLDSYLNRYNKTPIPDSIKNQPSSPTTPQGSLSVRNLNILLMT
jgi:hypothetical protein